MRMLTRAAAATLTVFFLAIPVHAQPRGSIIPDVVYGHKDGLALTFDVFKPASNSNGAGVLYIESGGWRSSWRPIEQSRSRFDTLLSKGFTVFVVRHGSAPRYNAHEAYGDVQRAVRFVRLHAQTYRVDPDRLGVYGGSAGGHLSLMLGLASDTGDPSAEDEVLRGSSQVAAVVAYYPPVDLRPQSPSDGGFPPVTTESYFYSNGLDVVPRRRVATPCCDTVHGAHERWPALDLEEAVAASISPIMYVSSDDPPTLLVHGDADVIVDLNASQMIHGALMKSHVETDLVVIEGAGHGFRTPEHLTRATDALVGWFEKHLTGH